MTYSVIGRSEEHSHGSTTLATSDWVWHGRAEARAGETPALQRPREILRSTQDDGQTPANTTADPRLRDVTATARQARLRQGCGGQASL